VQKVDFASLQQLETRLAQSASAMSDELRLLDERVALLKGGWTGEAARAYESAHLQWTARMGEMHDFLTRVSSAVGTARSAYTAAEHEFAAKL
jgi:WXG100 family type VII secretion target